MIPPRVCVPRPRCVLWCVLMSSLGFASQVDAQQLNPDHYAQFRARHIGPIGNRVSAVQGIPGDPLTYYVGAASGGV